MHSQRIKLPKEKKTEMLKIFQKRLQKCVEEKMFFYELKERGGYKETLYFKPAEIYVTLKKVNEEKKKKRRTK